MKQIIAIYLPLQNLAKKIPDAILKLTCSLPTTSKPYTNLEQASTNNLILLTNLPNHFFKQSSYENFLHLSLITSNNYNKPLK